MVRLLNDIQVDLAHYMSIRTWQPKAGDIVIWHGWFTHWFGIVNGFQPSGHVSIIKSGLPVDLLTMDQDRMAKSTVTVHITKIQASRGGEWAAVQSVNNQLTWYA